MPTRFFRCAVAVLSGFSLLSVSVLTHAATPPAVLHYPQGWDLPSTPAYANAAVAHDLRTLTTSRKTRTVNVVVDSSARIHALAQYAEATSTPKSPLYHQFLTPAQLNQRFGPTPAMIRVAENHMRTAGWTVTAHQGLVITARVPGASAHPGLPVDPDIWSMTGFSAHGLIRPAAAPIPHRIPAESSPRVASTSSSVPNFSLAGANFHQPPVVLQQTTESNGDVVSVMSWNPLVKTTVPAGLPVNLFVTVEDPEGNFLPISNVGNLNDSNNSLVSYGASSMPASSNTLWQLPIAAWQDIAAGDLLTLTVTLADGTALNASFPLPSFTGNSTVLTPLDAQQINTLSGIQSMPSSPGGLALFAIGTPPSLQDLSLYLDQNTTASTAMPSVTFEYEDGATAHEYGQAADTEESQLDLEGAAGAAPGAPIYEYVYPENDSNDPLISYLTDLSQQTSAKVASLSYGFFGEDPTTLTTLMNALTAEGITLVEASGDQGAWDGGSDPGPAGLSSLEQIPSVLSVGGVDLAAPAKTDSAGNTLAINGPVIADAWGGDFLNGIPTNVAQAYTNLNAASSGGYSTTTPIPSWQAGFLPPGSPGFGVPTLASMAGFPGMSGYLQGQNVLFGGTSLAAPLTAGWLDETEKALDLTPTGMGDVNPLLYQAASADPSLFTQALWGQDGVYSVTDTASGSWNPMTGLGMLNWGGFLNDYSALVPTAAPAVSLTGGPTAQVGHGVSMTAYVRGMTNPQYQFWYRTPQNGRWHSSGAYSSQSSFQVPTPVPGLYRVSVRAKTSGADTPPLIARTVVVAKTQKPLVSSLTVRPVPRTHVTHPGGWFRVYAHATDTGPWPEYQFWLHRPGSRPRIVKGWSGHGILFVNHLKPGTYVVTVDALDHAQVMHHRWAQAYRRTIAFRVK